VTGLGTGSGSRGRNMGVLNSELEKVGSGSLKYGYTQRCMKGLCFEYARFVTKGNISLSWPRHCFAATYLFVSLGQTTVKP